MADLSSLMDYYYESMYPEIKALEEERLRIIARLKSLATTLAISALVLAGVLACSMPMPVMASSDTEVVESLLDSGIDFLASDPGKAVDIIMYAKDLVDQQNITDDQVRSAITQAAEHFSVTLSDSEADSLVSVVRKVLDAQINEDALRSDVNSVYNKLKDMGVTKDDAKGLVAKLIDFVKGLFE